MDIAERAGSVMPHWSRQYALAATRAKQQRVSRADELISKLLLFYIVLNPIIDAYAGMNRATAIGSALPTVCRASWILLASVYALPGIEKTVNGALRQVMFPLLLLAVVAGVTETLLGDAASGIEAAARLSFLPVTIAATYRLRTRCIISKESLAVPVALGGVALLACIAAGGVFGLGVRNAYRNEGIAVSGTLFSAQTTGVFTLILHGILGLRWRNRVMRSIWGVSILAAVLTTGVRAALLMALGCAVIYALTTERRSRPRAPHTFKYFIGLFTVLLVTSAATALTWNRFPELQARWNDLSASGRTTFQAIVVRDILDRPTAEQLCGRGRQYVESLLGGSYGARIGAHNDFLDVWSAYGLLGLGTLIIGVIGICGASLRMRRAGWEWRCEHMAAVVSYMIASLTHGTINYMGFTFLFGIIIGMSFASVSNARRSVHLKQCQYQWSAR
ncbi:MAG: O-antigen ligase family protein [Terriglobales bacterium]